MSSNYDDRPDWVCRKCRRTNNSYLRKCRKCNSSRPDQSISLCDYMVQKGKKGRHKTALHVNEGYKPTSLTAELSREPSTYSNNPWEVSHSCLDSSQIDTDNNAGISWHFDEYAVDGEKEKNLDFPRLSEGGHGRLHRTPNTRKKYPWEPLDTQLDSYQTGENDGVAGQYPGDISASTSISSQRQCSLSKFKSRNREKKGGLDSVSQQRQPSELLVLHRALEEMLDAKHDDIVIQFFMENSSYDLFLEKPEDLSRHSMHLLVQLLVRAAETSVNMESFIIIFSKTFKPKFVNSLIRFILSSSLELEDQIKMDKFLQNLWLVMNKCAHEMPCCMVDRIYELVESCLMCQEKASVKQRSDLTEKFGSLKYYLEKKSKKLKSCARDYGKRKSKLTSFDCTQPPDNFREISVIPTTTELNNLERPFVRKNVICGKYQDAEHYLDVQFRLLREDFVRPLRETIQDIKGNNKLQNNDISVYRNVKILNGNFKDSAMIHDIQLEAQQLDRFQHSKKLMFGNLVCFSNDNFKTILFGSIFARDTEKLSNGILSIKFDSEISTSRTNLIMIESKAYFTAYKHVLKALQSITEDTFPFEEHIVHVETDIPPPDYLDDGAVYDLQVMRNDHMMKSSERNNCLFPKKRYHSSNKQIWPTLQKVPITKDFEYWPSCSDLGIDESQRRALRDALTSRFSIIQGPPGTGKTFLGLKIAQVLLHNSTYWKNDEQKSPVLVVCYTNHALDQFLEGMIPYTNSLVRVGSRSKSDILKSFQINRLLEDLNNSRRLPHDLCQRAHDTKITMNYLDGVASSLRLAFLELQEPVGIITLDTFLEENVISEDLALQFQSHNLSLSQYLLNPEFIQCVKQKASAETNVRRASKKVSNKLPLYSENRRRNVEALCAVEEFERKLDETDLEEGAGSKIAVRKFIRYDIVLKKLEEEICNRTALENVIKDITREMATSGSNRTKKIIVLQREIEALQSKLSITGNLEYILRQTENKKKLCDLGNTLSILKYGLTFPLDSDSGNITEDCDILFLNFEQRWQLYKQWLSRLAPKIAEKLRKEEKKLEKTAEEYKKIKELKYLHVMRHASVIGMTTTGAAEHNAILQALQPAIVIIEEAAEILEAHVVTSLTKECQHLIMIGDHQQLQPSATVYELATKYGLETSLFERLIKNGIAFETLEWQHRMRPNISKLLVPSVYPQLKDHESVQQYPHIKGMQKDVFFITHEYREDKEWDDVHSKANTYEAELLMALCRHLILQGYSTEDVTILTPYSGQFFVLKEVQQRHSECANVNISLVDNYQGEESNIVLLSLVRSNEEGSVGFLRKENRVCVALSRAKQGLYIAGNISQLKESNDLWRQVYENLLVDDCIGNSIGLKCENHPEVVTHVSSSKEILTLCPEGGCTMPCKSSLPDCGHKCPRMCHIMDADHANVKCPLPCSKKCENNHSCPRECWEDCPPCQALLPKTFPCKHRNNVPCCEYYSDQPCLKMVTKVLPVCQHEAILKCNENPSKFPCQKICGIQISCGHKCTRSCHLTDDPNHLDYRCEQPCRRVPAGCTEQHKCQKLCHEYCGSCTVSKEKIIKCGHSHNVLCSTRAEDVDCNKTCNRQLDCGHSCPRKCNELCGGCNVMVKKIIPNCHHIIQVACKEPALKSECEKPCSLKLTCGHSCQARCRDSCTVECKVGVTSEHKCPHGHHIKVPCHLLDTVSKEIAWTYCSRPCGTKLDCGHNCKGLCGQCFNGRLHAACDEKCGKRLVCGHSCNANCGLECPPCQSKCPVRCQHSRCQKKCGEPCSPCQEKCERSCQHHKCNKPCREKCSQRICEKSCRLKLMCGHSCIGFCSDPCPALCKVCHKDQLNELLSGAEDLGSARFVLLEDCGHVIEAKVLREWLSQETEEIGMKCCPRCKTPIFNNRRYHKFLLKVYANVRNLLDKYCKLKTVQVEKDFENLKQNLGALTCFDSEVQQISRCLPTKAPTYTQKLLNAVSDGEITLCKVQVEVLRVLDTLLAEHSVFRAALMPHVNALKKCLMRQMLSITPQMIGEIGCELQRISLLTPYWTFREKSKINGNDEVRKIEKDLQHLMSPSLKFDSEREKQFKQKLKESEKYVGDLDIKDHERFEIVKAVGLKHGHWYKCTKGHIYCTTEYGKAMEETLCFECETNLGK